MAKTQDERKETKCSHRLVYIFNTSTCIPNCVGIMGGFRFDLGLLTSVTDSVTDTESDSESVTESETE